MFWGINMDIINGIIKVLVSALDFLLPKLNLSPAFISGLDNAITLFIGILKTASFFVPLDVLVICITAMLVVDNFAILTRIGQFILKMIRG